MFVQHQKSHSIATFAAAEALENTSCRRYVERSRLFVMKRAQAHEVCPSLPERDEIAYHLLYLGGIVYLGNCLRVYHRGEKLIIR